MVVEKEKVWGSNTEVFRNDSCSVNLLKIKKNTTCSWHFHEHKSNKFLVVSGKIRIVTENASLQLHAGDAYTVNPRVQHRFVGVEDSVVVEVMYVEYDHEDIIRLSLGHVIGEDDDSTD